MRLGSEPVHARRLALMRSSRIFILITVPCSAALALWLLLLAGGCSTGMDRIDRRVAQLLAEGSGTLGPDAYPATVRPSPDTGAQNIGVHSPEATERPASVNPAATELQFRAMTEGDNVLARLEGYNTLVGDPLRLDLTASLRQAFKDSREYRFAEEDYIISALRLLIERHRWGPQFFDEVSADLIAAGDNGFYNTSVEIVNEFRVTQRLPYGGTVSARALARATEDLHSRVANGDNQSADFILDAQVPLLRGSGLAARESLIQRERELIYAARDFENFRRAFFLDIVADFLDLVVQQQSVVNAERQVEQLRLVEARERGLYESGRSDLFNAALAEQSTVSALDSLNQRREQYRLDVDRFKVRLGIDVEQPVVIVASDLGLPVPDVELDEAVRYAMAYRLDLQTQRDSVDDARRGVSIARNDLLPDMNLTGSVTVPTDDNRSWFRLEPEDTVVRAGVSIGLPLDREIERLTLRQLQIQLERSERNYDDLRDNITVNVRGAVRAIDRARYQLEIQDRNIRIGEDRIESIAAAPDRATARDASEAADDLLEAKDSRDEGQRDLQLAILAYLQQTGQLRISLDGRMLPLQGMEFSPAQPSAAQIKRDYYVIPWLLILPRPPAVLEPTPPNPGGS